MTNDTTTLNGALQELGETMADNLVTMGVTDAQASDGLTTLANKILDVPVTPVTQTLTLSSDKSILSYADSETATLTATLTGGTVSGQTIEFYNGSTSMGTATTNSSGIATMTYSSTGVGDVVFSATKNSVSSNTISIEDCVVYDTASTDKSSKFSTKNLNSLTFSNDHYVAYRSLGTSPASTYYSPVYIDGLTLPTDYEITVDVLMTVHDTNVQNGFNISNTVLETYSNGNEASIYKIGNSQGLYYRVNGSLTRYDVGTVISANVWHRFYMKVEGTTVIAKITNLSNDTVTLNKTQTLTNIQSWKKFNLSVGGRSSSMWFKNLKVKAL